MEIAEKDTDWGDILHAVYGRHAAKKLARATGLAIPTAKLWLSGAVSAVRARELAGQLLIELDRQEAERAVLRRRLAELRDAIRDRHELAAGARRARKGAHLVRGAD